MVWLGLVSLLLATGVWHVGDVQMLDAFEQGRKLHACLWILLHVVSIPLFAFSSYAFFRFHRSWWSVELPYLVTGLATSLVLFNRLLRVAITWRELVACGLILAAAYLVAGKHASAAVGNTIPPVADKNDGIVGADESPAL